ncbi:MAG: CehA/McbA family metallohydrolase [Acidobacteriota bacterium]
MPARIYLLRNGEPFRLQPVQASLPVKSDLFYRDRLWIEGADPDVLELICNDEYHYLLLKGRASFNLPPGKYALEAYRGFFYSPTRVEFELKADEARTITLPLKPWDGVRPEEWISADDHIHLTRTQRENSVFLGWLEAEDLNVANFLALQRQSDAAAQYAFGKAGEFARRGYSIRSGQETRNQSFGHILMLGGDELVRPMSTGKELANVPDDYPFHTLLFDLARKARALTGYAHFRETPTKSTFYMDLALGKLDLIELFQFGVLTTEPWYELLNAGFRITGVAGSDFPVYVQRLKPYPRWVPLIGPERALVKKSGTSSGGFAAWADGVRKGQVVVSNGPIVELSLEGGEARASAAFFRPLERLEIVRNGEVVASVAGDGARRRLALTVKAARDGWYAARVRAQREKDEPELQAHTNAMYPGGPVMIPSARRAIADRWEAEMKQYRGAGLSWGSAAREREFFEAGEMALQALRKPLR